MPDESFALNGKRVWVAGHRGLVGSALLRRLEDEPIGDRIVATSHELDLTRQEETERFVASVRPDIAIIAAARVGGIEANRTSPATFLYENLMILANTIEACRRAGVERPVVLGSSCIYPREAPQPIREDALLTGPLEPTNEGYAVAKIAGVELQRHYRREHGMDVISLMPTNLYGPGDDFDPRTAHVVPALLRRIDEAKHGGAQVVDIWGSGTPLREFLHIDDLADAVVHALRHYSGEQPLNVGSGEEISIAELARLIAEVVGWDGELRFDTSKPDGSPRKLLDSSRLRRELGWEPSIGLRDGVREVYDWYTQNRSGLVDHDD